MRGAVSYFLRGLRDGSPIGAGYFAVSFAFGIQAHTVGLSAWQTFVLSGSNLTSAGQFAGLTLINVGSTLLAAALTQLVINLRYALMACALSQRLPANISLWQRAIIACGVTDEIFGVSIGFPHQLRPIYSFGLLCAAWPGWAFGSLTGALAGDILPALATNALTMALFAMFVAIVVPAAKADRKLCIVSVIAALTSTALAYLPKVLGWSELSSGMRVVWVTLLVAGAAAFICPEPEAEAKEDAQ